jgi:peptidoglycan/LPS O-acetylase OafA/YrhL
VPPRAERTEIVVAAGYLAAMTVWIYAIALPQVGYVSDVAGAVFLAALAAVHVATGWGVGRWWAVLLPAVAVVLALPAGTPERGDEPFPVWFALAVFIAPPGTLLIALAVTARRWPRHRSSAS